ncbi:MAG: SusC/RagA family TonB-linked outer membrane protein [Chitinophaga sp.]|uniref:SusC/RagA family TonB-linked outer membrane protein n=1 Tax=Chitinophaga sp. TaxID=1869181 RepID=UPI001B26A71F|nr:SusC/RagA family TonB-linked outer membrane protein [Chitinophaga sp.]MBO9732122.1 SusC/RagA family TonB-linked outer membrane protein [Chitinophaga sp.]
MRKSTALSFIKRDVKCFVLYGPFLLLLLLLNTATRLHAQDNSGQEILSRRISYEANHASLSKVLKDIREKTKIRFTYNTELVARQAAVTVKADNVTLEALLKEVLTNTGLMFSVAMDGIIIYEPDRKDKKTKEGRVIQGRVTDNIGNPLSGVSIKGLSSKEMTVTQADGTFFLIPWLGEQISLSRVGMKTITYRIGQESMGQMVFKMDSVVQEIKEVIVNGYQKIDPRLFTGAVTKLTAAEIMQPGMPTIDKMLQGKVPGLMVMNTSGSVNAKPTLRIRGTSTLLGNASPLWVVDGVIRPEPVDVSNALLNNLIGSTAQSGFDGAAQSNFDIMGNAISGVSPFDVESITFLKDAAATSIYGTRAANGVIVVTTKTGKAGPMQISYNTNLSFQQRPNYNRLHLMNSKQRVELSRQLEEDGVTFSDQYSGFEETVSYEGQLRALYARQITEDQFNRNVAQMETRNTDWFKVLFRNQFSMQHNLSMSGGAGKTTYRASFGYADQKSSAIGDGNKKYNALINLQSQVGKKLNIFVSLSENYMEANSFYPSISPMSYAIQTNRAFSPDIFYPISRGVTLNNEGLGSSTQELRPVINPPLVFNMLNDMQHTFNNGKTQGTTVSVQLDYKLLKGLTLRSNANAVINSSEGEVGYDQQSYAASLMRGWNMDWSASAPDLAVQLTPLPVGGVVTFNNQRSVTMSITNSIDYSVGLFHDRDLFNVSLNHEMSSTRINGTTNTQAGYFPERGKTFFASPVGRRLINNQVELDQRNNRLGVFATAGYNMAGRYTVYGTIRTDGTNRFGQYTNSKFLPNWDVSGQWNVSGEKWFPTKGISALQIHTSYGTQGNAVTSVGPNLIANYSTNAQLNSRTQLPYMRIKSLPYPDLRWEKTYQWNIGTQIGFFNNRLTSSFDFFTKHSVDLLDYVNIPYEYGRSTMFRNKGVIDGQGWDLSVNIVPVRRKNTEFSITVTASRVTSTLASSVSEPSLASLFDGSGRLPGRPVSGFYSYQFTGLSHTNGIPQFGKLNMKGITSNPDDILVYSGQSQPNVYLNISPTFRYKSLSVTSAFYLSLGSTKRLNSPFVMGNDYNSVPSPYANTPISYFDRWRKPGDELKTNIPGIVSDVPRTEWPAVPYYVATSSTSTTATAIFVNPYAAYNLSDIRTIKNNYLRCNMLAVNYTVPARYMKGKGLKNLTMGFNVNHVFVIANRKLNGQDPEASDFNSGYNALPLARTYAFSLSAAL